MATDTQKAGLAKARAAKAAKAEREQSVNDEPVTDDSPEPEHEVAEEAESDVPTGEVTDAEIAQAEADEAEADPLDALVANIASGISPGRAREEADAAEVRSHGSGAGQQAELERRLAVRLRAVADAHDREQAVATERAHRLSGVYHKGVDGGPAEPIPETLHRGDIVVVHQDPRRPDTFGLVLRLHPKVEVDGAAYHWRADLLLCPLQGAPSVADGVPFGHGVGQFSEAPDDETETGARVPGLPDGEYEKPWESRI